MKVLGALLVPGALVGKHWYTLYTLYNIPFIKDWLNS
jgi:hypothetical protein